MKSASYSGTYARSLPIVAADKIKETTGGARLDSFLPLVDLTMSPGQDKETLAPWGQKENAGGQKQGAGGDRDP